MNGGTFDGGNVSTPINLYVCVLYAAPCSNKIHSLEIESNQMKRKLLADQTVDWFFFFFFCFHSLPFICSILVSRRLLRVFHSVSDFSIPITRTISTRKWRRKKPNEIFHWKRLLWMSKKLIFIYSMEMQWRTISHRNRFLSFFIFGRCWFWHGTNIGLDSILNA